MILHMEPPTPQSVRELRNEADLCLVPYLGDKSQRTGLSLQQAKIYLGRNEARGTQATNKALFEWGNELLKHLAYDCGTTASVADHKAVFLKKSCSCSQRA